MGAKCHVSNLSVSWTSKLNEINNNVFCISNQIEYFDGGYDKSSKCTVILELYVINSNYQIHIFMKTDLEKGDKETFCCCHAILRTARNKLKQKSQINHDSMNI